MNFLGVGPLELIVILVVALIFVGPERLPKLAADIARTIREIRKYTGSIAAEFTDVLQEFEKETEPEKSQWKEIGQGLTDATKSVTDAFRDAHAAAAGTPVPPSTNGSTPAPATPAPVAPAAFPVPENGVTTLSDAPGAAMDARPPAPSAAPDPEAAAPTNGVHPAAPEPANEAV
ncbi:MAG TPA: twin-arginine translocase TatA/TatE family subunit [Dehalococcoidia bacterium]|nr:twin-arginine translocase TatA/TatE family subunit [Dehalococcoidia bacterium]